MTKPIFYLHSTTYILQDISTYGKMHTLGKKTMHKVQIRTFTFKDLEKHISFLLLLLQITTHFLVA